MKFFQSAFLAAIFCTRLFALEYSIFGSRGDLGKIGLPASFEGELISTTDKDIITFTPYYSGSYHVALLPYTGPNALYFATITEEGAISGTSVSSFSISFFSFSFDISFCK